MLDNIDEHDEADTGLQGNVTPLKAARRHCLDCCKGSANEVRLCPARECALWLYRHGRRPTAEEIAKAAHVPLYPEERPISTGEFHANGGTALKAIRRRCIDCSGNSLDEVRDCWAKPGVKNACDLWPFRMGKNPNYGSMSDKTRAKIYGPQGER